MWLGEELRKSFKNKDRIEITRVQMNELDPKSRAKTREEVNQD